MIHRLIKRIIDNGNYDKEDLTRKINVFYLNGQLSEKEYEELLELLETV